SGRCLEGGGNRSAGTPLSSGSGVPAARHVDDVALGPVSAIMGRMATSATSGRPCLRAGMVALGMIFDDTYRPVFESLRRTGLFRRGFGLTEGEGSAVASRTAAPAQPLHQASRDRLSTLA